MICQKYHLNLLRGQSSEIDYKIWEDYRTINKIRLFQRQESHNFVSVFDSINSWLLQVEQQQSERTNSGSSTFSQLPSIASFENDSANNLPKPSSSVENFTSFTEDARKVLPWSPFVQAQIDKLPSQKVHQPSKGIFKVFGHSRSRSKSSLVKRQSTPRNVLNIFEPIKQSRIAINKTEFINTLQALQLKVYHWEHVKDIEDANGVTFLVIQVPNFVHQDHFLVLS
eukprot:TRINITY_DN2592_c0_g1_i10.p1 TRINITY_DN2592_c0_g1~~TRINITY_DN2592_c0_g1_i10.p1  ORF type:complete len:226 (-),score=8.50 TRINITY_DN2592_c0_g1_i10:79-756(-)